MMIASECPVPVEELLEVQVERTSVALGNDTSVGSELAIVHIVDGGASCLIDTDTGIECESEVLEELDLGISGTIYCITFRVVVIAYII